MKIWKQIKEDVKPFIDGKQFKLFWFFIVYFFDPSFKLIFKIRLQEYFRQKNMKLLKNYIHWRIYKVHNCDIADTAIIGQKVHFPHPIGIVIGAGTIIGDNVTIFQNVTFGSHGKKGEVKKYPIVKDNVIIYAGAKIIGGITINENAIIAANAVVVKDVKENTVVAGVPAKELLS